MPAGISAHNLASVSLPAGVSYRRCHLSIACCHMALPSGTALTIQQCSGARCQSNSAATRRPATAVPSSFEQPHSSLQLSPLFADLSFSARTPPLPPSCCQSNPSPSLQFEITNPASPSQPQPPTCPQPLLVLLTGGDGGRRPSPRDSECSHQKFPGNFRILGPGL